MYLKHFGFRQAPFAINPDPRFLYLSPKHQEALAHLLYGLGEGGGFVMLSGEVGTGKTTLCFTLLEQMGGNVDVALILNPRLSSLELLAAICDELHIAYPVDCASPKRLIDQLNQFLLSNHARGRRTVAIIDEAQNLSTEVLEQIRLLTNLETPTTKLLQIILVGQPELPDLLARPEVRQVDQRITARYHLQPLDAEEARGYVLHRIAVAGGPADLFTTNALHEVYHRSRGIPRLINVLCDRALLGAYTLERKRVDHRMVTKAANEVRGHRRQRHGLWAPALATAFIGLASASLINLWWDFSAPARPAPKPAIAANAAARDTIAAVRDAEPASGHATAAAEPPAPVPVPTPPAEAKFPVWIDLPANEEASALGRLLLRWRPNEVFRRTSCAEVKPSGLRCLRQRSDWETLRRQNLPALMSFAVTPSRSREAVLISADDTHATLIDAAGHSARFPLAEVLALWSGNSLSLWQPPEGRSLVSRGMRGPSVTWVRQRLQTAGYLTVPLDLPEHFDPALEESLSRFQKDLGLRPDGLAGPATLARLTGIQSGSDIPALRASSTP
jgi:general secretion pathway protein A